MYMYVRTCGLPDMHITIFTGVDGYLQIQWLKGILHTYVATYICVCSNLLHVLDIIVQSLKTTGFLYSLSLNNHMYSSIYACILRMY